MLLPFSRGVNGNTCLGALRVPCPGEARQLRQVQRGSAGQRRRIREDFYAPFEEFTGCLASNTRRQRGPETKNSYQAELRPVKRFYIWVQSYKFGKPDAASRYQRETPRLRGVKTYFVGTKIMAMI
ncbi:hypothetical protein E2C01_011603 [Portunus trituberculatus]|uniref:Uncharacterized protein n=1 Tax=Portunus trituberculatus TaxID=210409 RepID=A0A5B7DBU7_PORTR|nr:hypothetical protein [Portunus trituberculatus]